MKDLISLGRGYGRNIRDERREIKKCSFVILILVSSSQSRSFSSGTIIFASLGHEKIFFCLHRNDQSTSFAFKSHLLVSEIRLTIESMRGEIISLKKSKIFEF